MQRISCQDKSTLTYLSIHVKASSSTRLFMARLAEIIAELHVQYRIYHRDLHSGNVMINLAQPNDPIIIDFGDATKQLLSSEDPYREIVRGKSRIYPNDLDNIRELRIELQKYLKKKGVKL
ncbi:MAG: phosphotransferase [Patescibacteria group bacterium]